MTSDEAEAAAIRNEVRVEKTLTASHRLVRFRVGRRQGLQRSLLGYIHAITPRYEAELVRGWCARGHITVDDGAADPDARVAADQQVEMRIPLPPADPTYAVPPLELLHVDERLLVANKAVGHLAHQAGRIMTGTLINQLQDWVQERGGDPNQVRLANRIDRDTSGIVIGTRDLAAHQVVAGALAARQVRKEYLAICHGVPAPADGEWTDPIGIPPGRPETIRAVMADGQDARTEYHVLDEAPGGAYALLRIVLHTGRQHQIRVHAAHHGHALVGDWVYGTRCAELPGQALHAELLVVPHPDDGRELRITAPLTTRLRELWQRLLAGGAPTPEALSDEQRSKLGLIPPPDFVRRR